LKRLEHAAGVALTEMRERFVDVLAGEFPGGSE